MFQGWILLVRKEYIVNKFFMKKLILIFTFFIPIKRVRRKLREQLYRKFDYQKRDSNFNFKIKQIQTKKKVNIVFLVVYDSVFPAKPLLEKMLDDELFEPKILIIPDILRGEANLFYQLEKSYNHFVELYGKELVLNSFDNERKEFVDYVGLFDMACFANPYDNMTNRLYSIEYFFDNKVLPIYINYGTMPDYYAINHIINLKSLNLCWKVFVDTKENLEDVIRYSDLKGKNAVFSGYCKMDSLDNVRKIKLNRKKIIIAPHHTVNNEEFPLSNFIKYSEFFLELPYIYPEVDFVFRPHPLLFLTLSKSEFWGGQRVKDYINKMSSIPNVEYQNGGDYFETFVNSSGIIHDCSSFLMEYLYTGKPACYMLKNEKETEKIFSSIGRKCLEYYYKAFDKKDIINFINNVVLDEKDYLGESRVIFSHNEIMVNYPNVSSFIVNNIKEDLK